MPENKLPPAAEGIRKLNEWGLAQLQRTEKALLATPGWTNSDDGHKQLELVQAQIADLKRKLGIGDV